MKKQKIFVTGAEGFIGSHLVEKLVLSGYEVKSLVLYNYQNSYGWIDHIDKNIKKNLEIITGDIRDISMLEKEFKGIDTVFHLAALIGIPYSYISPNSYVKTNIEGSFNVFNAALKNDVSLVVNTSTSEVYGSAQTVPIKENHILSAQSPYAASKIAADQIGMSYFKSFNLPLAIIRPFNTFGPRQSARAVISTIIIQALTGSKIKLGNTYSTRDFTFVEDAVNAFSKCINNRKILGQTFNLGTGYEISVKDIVKMVSVILNKKLIIVKDNKRIRPNKSEVDRLVASNLKGKKLLKWKPKFSGQEGFKRGLELTIKWFESNLDKKNFKTNIYNV